MKNIYESSNEIKKMQEEAFKRVQEMQKRAKRSLEYSQPYSQKTASPENEALKSSNNEINSTEKDTFKVEEKKVIPQKELNFRSLTTKPEKNHILSLITGDNEKNLILLLLMLLVDEETDISLVLALMYLIIW